VVRLGLHLLARAARQPCRPTHGDHAEGPEADLYLEGHDQHRGWFHSSLLLGCALFGRAPYKGLLTHGFTVDSQGRKMSKSLGNGIDPQEVNKKLGAEIIRLWVAATDYSGDIAGDDKILARVVDAYRRIRNTLRFLLANTSDFDPATDAVPTPSCWRSTATPWPAPPAAGRDPGPLRPLRVPPGGAKLQVYCSEDLGAFYLDVLKDRLYTTAPKSLARRSAQTALWQITHAMLRWMAPFLSFTAEEAWPIVAGANQGSIFFETFWKFTTPDEALLAKWGRIRAIRELANKEIEALRAAGQVGASLQATLTITAGADDAALLRSLGEDLKFVTITSAATVVDGPSWPSRWRPAAPSSASAAGTTATTWAATRPTHAVRPLQQQPPRRGRNPHRGLSGEGMARSSSARSKSSGGSTNLWVWLGLAAVVILLDQFSKTLILGFFQLGDSHTVTSFFNVVRVHNPVQPSPSWPGPRAGSAGSSSAWARRPRLSSSGCCAATRPDPVLLRGQHDPGRRAGQCDRPGHPRLCGRLHPGPLRRALLPVLQPGRQRHHAGRHLPDPGRAAPGAQGLSPVLQWPDGRLAPCCSRPSTPPATWGG
jgi:hypothetical protein